MKKWIKINLLTNILEAMSKGKKGNREHNSEYIKLCGNIMPLVNKHWDHINIVWYWPYIHICLPYRREVKEIQSHCTQLERRRHLFVIMFSTQRVVTWIGRRSRPLEELEMKVFELMKNVIQGFGRLVLNIWAPSTQPNSRLTFSLL